MTPPSGPWRRAHVWALGEPGGLRLTGILSVTAVGVGLILRLLQLLANRSLSQDEAQLALNLMDRSFVRLFARLDFNQAAPDGFLAAQKIVVEILGGNDYSLRLFPFVTGGLALVLILFLARGFLTALAVPVAVALFAFSDPAIYYTTADKQYAVDVLGTVVVLWLGCRLTDRPDRLAPAALFGAAGAIVIWFSHSSVFVLAGMSTALVAGALARKRWLIALRISAACALWVGSFGVFTLTSFKHVSGIRASLASTSGALGHSGSADLIDSGGLRTSLGAFRYIASVPHFLERGTFDAGQLILLLAVGFCAVGLVSITARRPEKGVALFGAFAFMLIAWAIGEYPLLGRTQLFLIPVYVLLLAEGMVQLALKARHPGARAAAVAAAGAVAGAVAALAVGHVIHPRTTNEMKPVLDHIAREQRPGDTVYAFYTAQPQLRYYLECGCAGRRFEAAQRAGLWPLRKGPGGPAQFAPAMRSSPPRLFVGQFRDSDLAFYESGFDVLRGRKRVWVLLPEVGAPMRAALLAGLDRLGTRRATFAAGDVDDFKTAVVVYLYDMSRSGRGGRP